jgi:hypothetical protein
MAMILVIPTALQALTHVLPPSSLLPTPSIPSLSFSLQVWQWQMMRLAFDGLDDPWMPPPLNLPEDAYFLLSRAFRAAAEAAATCFGQGRGKVFPQGSNAKDGAGKESKSEKIEVSRLREHTKRHRRAERRTRAGEGY